MGLPMVEDGELRVHDAVAIMIYLSRKYENVSLIGQTPQNMVNLYLRRREFKRF
jgi:glutathione S-transferase